MAFYWLRNMVFGDRTYEFIVPPVSFEYTAGSDFYAGNGGNEGSTAYNEALPLAASINSQTCTYDFTQTKAYSVSTVLGEGGLRIVQNYNYFPYNIGLTIQFYNNLLSVKGSRAIGSTNYDGWTMDFATSGLCCAVDEDAGLLFFGLAGGLKGRRPTNVTYCEYGVNVWCNNVSQCNLYNELKAGIPAQPTPGGGGPYDDGGTSAPGTQEASWDDTSDVISVPAAPSFSLILNKLIHAWAPSVSDLDDIGTYLWSNFDLTDPKKTLSKVFQSPLESILTLHALPFAVSSGTAIELTLAGFATGVQLPPLTAQFKDVPCGSITIEPYWDNYLDYNPYTKLTLCLPFAGQVTLDPDEVMGKTVSVTYRVDCLTGSFVCFVFIDGDKVLGQYAGNCALSIPISAADYGRFNAAILGVAATAASAFGAAASGGLMTPMGLADGGMTITGGPLNAGALAGAGRQIGGSLVQNVQNAKVHVAHSGGLTGAPGFMGIQKPYLIIHRARQSVPESYGSFKGYPLNVTKTLGECSGFTSVREIHLDGIPLTEPELEELRAILEGGIII